MPLFARFAVSLGAQALREQRSEALLPLPHGLMGEGEAAREEHLGQIAQAEFVAQPPEHDEQRAVGGDLQVVDGRARPLVEGTPAGTTAE